MFSTFDKYFMELMILPSGSNVCIMYKYKPAVSQKDTKVVKMLDISQYDSRPIIKMNQRRQ